MKPFNLEEAIAGKPIVCRDGTPAKFLYYEESIPGEFKVGAFTTKGGQIMRYTEEGQFYYSKTSSLDLLMASEQKSGWINIYPNNDLGGHIYKTKQSAEAIGTGRAVATIEIHWEE